MLVDRIQIQSMKSVLLFFCFMATYSLSGQINLSASFQSNNYLNWNDKDLSTANPQAQAAFNSLKGLGIDLEYSYLPDKERQLYFIGRLGSDISFSNQSYSKIIFPHAGAGILFYPFNMNGDCDCPRFHQEGTFFSRGFHFVLLANAGMFILKNEASQFQGLFEANFGINIPLGNTQAIAPFFGFALGTNVKNQYLEVPVKSTLNKLLFGIRYFLK